MNGCPMCGGEGALLGSLGPLLHLRCRQCGWTYHEGDTDDCRAVDVVVGESCDGCGTEGACVDTRGDQVLCRDCAMRHDDQERTDG